MPVYWVAITSLKSGDNRDKTAGFSPLVDYASTAESGRSERLSLKKVQVGGEAEERARFSATLMMMVRPLVLANLVHKHLCRSVIDRRSAKIPPRTNGSFFRPASTA